MLASSGYLRDFTLAGDYNSYGSSGMVYNPRTGAYDSVTADPFNTKLPPTTKVLWILCTYFVVIIPINFLLLKKLKRGEWAWFTAPVISLSFAGAFFAAASDLYSAKLSTATQGLLVATAHTPETLFFGKSQLFFPRGGEYDLKLQNLDSLGAGQGDPYDYSGGYRSRQEYGGLNAIDIAARPNNPYLLHRIRRRTIR